MQREYRRAAGRDGRGQVLFAGSSVRQYVESELLQSLSHHRVALGRPAFRTPSGAGSNKDDGPRFAGEGRRKPAVAPAFGLGIDGQRWLRRYERVTGYGRSQLHILLDHVRAARAHALGKQPLRGPFARPGLANAAQAASQTHNGSRPDCTLQIDDRIVLCCPQLEAQCIDLGCGCESQRSALPRARRGKVQPVNDRHCGPAYSTALCSLIHDPWRSQQRLPARIHYPADLPCGMSKAQRCHGRKCVQNVAHGAQADYKQAKVGLCRQSSVQFSHKPDRRIGVRATVIQE
jgi:hypothetical protein